MKDQQKFDRGKETAAKSPPRVPLTPGGLKRCALASTQEWSGIKADFKGEPKQHTDLSAKGTPLQLRGLKHNIYPNTGWTI